MTVIVTDGRIHLFVTAPIGGSEVIRILLISSPFTDVTIQNTKKSIIIINGAIGRIGAEIMSLSQATGKLKQEQYMFIHNGKRVIA